MSELITITIKNHDHSVRVPNGVSDQVVEAFASEYEYQESILDETGNQIPNPVSKARFFSIKIREYVQSIVKAAAIKQARKQAESAATQQIETLFDQMEIL